MPSVPADPAAPPPQPSSDDDGVSLSRSGLAWTSLRAWLVLLATIIITLAADLGSKYWAFRTIAGTPVVFTREDVLEVGPSRLQSLIPPHAPKVVVPELLNLHLVLNAGAVFGAGQGKRWFFITFTFAALGFALFMFARWTSRRDHLSHACIALIISGGLGNLYDRVLYACVRDFLHPLPNAKLPFGLAWPSGDRALWPYVSNVADAFLLIGIGLLLIRLWRAEPPTPSAAARD